MDTSRFARFIVVGLLALFIPTPAVADSPVIHSTIPISQTATVALFPDTASCVGYPGTLTVVETGAMYVTEFVAGPNAGRTHIRIVTTTAITIQPDDPAMGPTYSGSGPLRLNLKVKSDEDSVSSFTTTLDGASAEGAPLKVHVHEHVVMKNGEIKLEFRKFNCVKPGV